MSTYLQNEDNYLSSLQSTEKECFINYIKITNAFIVDFNANIIYQNSKKRVFMLERGMEVIGHVFMQFLLYSNNLELTVELTERAYLYYIEFVGQMGEEPNTVFNLSCQDAILFAYKKTIFEIPHKIKTEFNTSENTILLSYIKTYIEIYDLLISYHLNRHSSIENVDIFLPITDSLLQLPLMCSYLQCIYSLIEFLQTKKVTEPIYLQIIDHFIKQITKKPITLGKLEKKYLSTHFEYMMENTPSKIVKWFTS